MSKWVRRIRRPSVIKKVNTLFWVLCGLLILLNVVRAFTKDWNYADPIDFRGVWIGSQLYESNQSLYSDSLGAEIWLEAKKQEVFESNSDFGDQWISISVYPPQAFLTFYPLGTLGWKSARIVWWLICFLSFLIIGFVLFKLSNKWSIALLLGMAASFFALSLGQPLLPCLALIALAVYLGKDKPSIAGVLLALALFKFTIVLPFFLWFGAKRNWKLMLTTVLTGALIFIPIYLAYPHIIWDYVGKTSSYYALIHTLDPQNTYTFSNSELFTVLNYYFDLNLTFELNLILWKFINLCLMLTGFSVVLTSKASGRLDDASTLFGLLLVSFVFSYHLSYDVLVFLIPIVLMRKNSMLWIVSVAMLLLLSLPINRMFDAAPLIKLHYPILLFGTLLWFLFHLYSKSKINFAAN